MKAQLFTGARGKITFVPKKADGSAADAVTLAFVTDVSVSENAGLRPTYVVGSLNPVGIEPLSIDVTCSVGRIIPINDAWKPDADGKLEALPAGTAIDRGLEPRINDILALHDVEINIVDKVTDKVVASVKNARFAGRSTSVSSGDVASERFNFVGIYDGHYDNTNSLGTETGYGLEKA